jgi:hypothetical protein
MQAPLVDDLKTVFEFTKQRPRLESDSERLLLQRYIQRLAGCVYLLSLIVCVVRRAVQPDGECGRE